MRFYFICILVLIFKLLHSNDVSFDRISTIDGLSQNDVLSLMQDSRGFLWVGTNDGLNRYDGYEFKVYRTSNKNENSIVSNLITNTIEDREGNIWIATHNKGISKLNMLTDSFTNFFNSPLNPRLLSSNIIQKIFMDSQNRLWVATLNGINIISKDSAGEYITSTVDHNLGEEASSLEFRVFSFYENTQKQIVITYTLGIIVATNQSNNPLDIQIAPFFKSDKVNNIRCLFEIPEGYLIGHSSGLDILKPINISSKEFVRTPIDYDKVNDMVLTREGNLWVGGINGLKFFKYNTKLEKLFERKDIYLGGAGKGNLSQSNVKSLYLDNSGILWIGTLSGGINKYNEHGIKFQLFNSKSTDGGPKDRVKAIFEDADKNVWLGTEDGISVLPGERQKEYATGFQSLGNYKTNERNFTFSFLEPGEQYEYDIFSGNSRALGLCGINKESGKWEVHQAILPILGDVRALLKDEYSAIWIGTYNYGIYRLNYTDKGVKQDNFTNQNYNMSSNIIRSFLEDSKGRIWIGTADGLMLLTQEEKRSQSPKFINFKFNKLDTLSISSNYILPIVESLDGTIWVGTLGGGLNKYIEGTGPEDGKFERISTDDGLPNNSIKQILEDRAGVLWIGTNKGITRFDPKNWSIRNYDIIDGIQDYEFGELAGCVLHDGEILMGGVNGINAFYPDKIVQDTLSPSLVFTDLQIHDKYVRVGQKIKDEVILEKNINETKHLNLKYYLNNFSIFFAALHFSNPSSNTYKVQLENYDPDWYEVSSGARFAKYNNLDAGTYIFKVMAANSDGYWTKESKNLVVQIYPPFWKTWWFKILGAVGFFFLVASFFLVRMRNLRAQKKHLEETVKERTEELSEINTNLDEKQEEIVAQNEKILNQHTELQKHRDNLEALVEERTSELRVAKEKAEASERMKSAFVNNMSHEVRTPMNAIVGFSSLLARDNLGEDARNKYISLIKTNSDALLVIISDILDLSMLEAGNLKLKIDTYRLNVIVEDVFATAKVSGEAKNLELILNNQLKSRDLQISTDYVRLSQILFNLLSNAVKFTTSGYVKLNIDIENNELLFSVNDSGIGIKQEDLSEIFEQFRKIEKHRDSFYPGVGLGLAISNRLAAYMGGRMWAESVYGEGSNFYLALPDLVLFDKDMAKVNPEKSLRKKFKWDDKTILIAEDEYTNFLLLEGLLSLTNCNIVHAANGKLAVDLIAQGNEYDLVLMDIKMPVMNGVDAFKAINEINPEQKIVALTAFAQESDKEKILAIGFHNYLSKPINEKEFFKVIDQYLNKKT